MSEANARLRLLDEHELAAEGPPEAIRLPLDLIDPNPDNPRRQYTEIDQLADSIADPDIGLLQPILVRRIGDRYQILAGHRRFTAFQMLHKAQPHAPQWRTIPAVVRRMDDDAAYVALLSAQFHTRPFSSREEASALERLAATGLTLKQIGTKLHRTEGWTSRRLRVYADAILSPYVQTGKLLVTVAEQLLPISDPKLRKSLAEQAAKNQWSQPKVRAEVRNLAVDRQLSRIDALQRELMQLLSSVEPGRISVDLGLDLAALAKRIDTLGGRRPVHMPTVEQAKRAAGISEHPRPRRKSVKPAKRTRFRTA
jgi:ParB/RepB/Spo0J family partition protein